jgi:hypothetical protein
MNTVKFRVIQLLCFVLFKTQLPAQTLTGPLTAAYAGASAYSLNNNDAFSFTANTAALSSVKDISIGVYGERRFLLDQLNRYIIIGTVPTRSGNFGVNANYFGVADYNETKLGFAYARDLGKKASLGIQFNYHGTVIAGYGHASATTVEIGLITHLSSKLHSGIQIINPVGGKFGNNQQEKLPSVYAIGFGYDASEKFLFSAEIIKEEDQLVNVNTGIQYKILPLLWIRTGISSATSSAWIGIGLQRGSMRIDITTAWHPQLGLSPGMLWLYSFNKKVKQGER